MPLSLKAVVPPSIPSSSVSKKPSIYFFIISAEWSILIGFPNFSALLVRLEEEVPMEDTTCSDHNGLTAIVAPGASNWNPTGGDLLS
ncbi:hypothetical protein DPMN_122858 [Dreissena polymorpha]|uniref:Uncharacterized protein n=1 Tax=Dreissena polymorpha TaxID=45954 RepID=A0A9D4GT83_DREPO|nr:hypothetical protein DPMN_122858 [Dreissena polymorpha]